MTPPPGSSPPGSRPVRIKRPSERRSLSRSATRALDVLEFFGEARRPLRAVEISRLLNMHPSTTNQLLKTMVDSAHLVFDARAKTYLPSPRLADFAGWMTETYGADGRIRALVRDVQARTGMVVTVTTPNDLFMQVIDLATPDWHRPERGLQVSLFGTAIGSAYLATQDDAEIRRLAWRARIAEADMPALLETVALVRREGLAHGPSGGADGGLWSLAVPMPPQGLRVPAVLGLAGPREAVLEHLDDLGEAMKAGIARWLTSASSE